MERKKKRKRKERRWRGRERKRWRATTRYNMACNHLNHKLHEIPPAPKRDGIKTSQREREIERDSRGE